jgi:FlaA1/EpsC-like NDP-sugar epimerase
MIWQHLDRALTRIRPHREPLALLSDALIVALCWHVTYLFRLGYERWHSARPAYDGWVMAALVAVYVAVFALLRVPKGMWRFSGFGEIQRLTLACALAGLIGAVGVLMAQLVEVPRAVLGLHPVVSLMGLAMVRIGYRMCS